MREKLRLSLHVTAVTRYKIHLPWAPISGLLPRKTACHVLRDGKLFHVDA